MKLDSLYKDGMKVCIFSKARHEQFKTGWFRGGDNISYTKNETQSTYIPTKEVLFNISIKDCQLKLIYSLIRLKLNNQT